MSIRVTITKAGVTDTYGLPMVVGTTYTVADDFGLSLISQGKASDTDSSLVNPGVREADPLNVVYCNAATIASPTAQMLASYNTVFALDVAPFTRYRANGTYLVPEAQYTTDASGKIIGLAGANGATLKIPRLIAEKTAITDGAIQTADQVIGSLSIPAGSLNVGDCFRVLATIGRDNGTDAYGSATTFRMGTAGSPADTGATTANWSSSFTAAGSSLSTGIEKWFRVVSIGANSVIEVLGVGNATSSWNNINLSGSAVGTQATLTGYNLTTQAGFFTITTTMGAATATKPRTGYMRLEIQT